MEEETAEGVEVDSSSGSEAEEAEEEEETSEALKPKKRSRSVLTGRGVTLAMLLNDSIVKPGEKCLSIDYLGQKFQADLLPDGKIRWVEANKLFNSPSAWAIYCKKLVNPSKKSGCGWASVKYNGKKLDQYKSVWFKRKRPQFGQTSSSSTSQSKPFPTTPTIKSPTATSTPKPDTPAPKPRGKPGRPRSIKSPPLELKGPFLTSPTGSKQSQPVTFKPPIPSGTSTGGQRSPILSGVVPPKDKTDAKQDLQMKIRAKMKVMEAEKAVRSGAAESSGQRGEMDQYEPRIPPACGSPTYPGQVPLLSPPPPGRKKQFRSRISHKHSAVNTESDPLSLVECMSFTSLGKIQPFSVSISTNTLLLMDFHCHLTSSEVVGYLGGKWDPSTHHIKIVQAFPCKIRFGDKENAGKVENQIRDHMNSLGLHAVGWYHSHPADQPDPSVQDINNQLSFQQSILQRDPTSKQPLVGFILSPYDMYRPNKETTIRAFWVQPPQESSTNNLGVPMLINFTIQQDQFLSQDLLNEMRWLGSCYKGCPDSIQFSTMWHNDVSYLEKVKESLMKKFPTDQVDGHFANFIQTLLT